MIYFESQQKNPLMAVSLEILIPNGGYHYLDRAAITNLPFSLIRWGSGVLSLYLIHLEIEDRKDYRFSRLISGNSSSSSGSSLHSYDVTQPQEFVYPLAVYSLFTIIQMHDLIEKTAEYNNQCL